MRKILNIPLRQAQNVQKRFAVKNSQVDAQSVNVPQDNLERFQRSLQQLDFSKTRLFEVAIQKGTEILASNMKLGMVH